MKKDVCKLSLRVRLISVAENVQWKLMNLIERARRGDIEAVSVLLDRHDPQQDRREHPNDSLLLKAAITSQSYDIVKFLLDRGKAPNLGPILTYACKYHNCDIIDLLLERQAEAIMVQLYCLIPKYLPAV